MERKSEGGKSKVEIEKEKREGGGLWGEERERWREEERQKDRESEREKGGRKQGST